MLGGVLPPSAHPHWREPPGLPPPPPARRWPSRTHQPRSAAASRPRRMRRCFPTKAIAIWTSTGDMDHVWIVGRWVLLGRGGSRGGGRGACGRAATGGVPPHSPLALRRLLTRPSLPSPPPLPPLHNTHTAPPSAVTSYFHYSVPGGFEAPQARDISPPGGMFGKTDPMYVVSARKAAAA